MQKEPEEELLLKELLKRTPHGLQGPYKDPTRTTLTKELLVMSSYKEFLTMKNSSGALQEPHKNSSVSLTELYTSSARAL